MAAETRCPDCVNEEKPGACPWCHGTNDDNGVRMTMCAVCKRTGQCMTCQGTGYASGPRTVKPTA